MSARFQYQRVAIDDGGGNTTYQPINYTPPGQPVDLPQNARLPELKEIVYEEWPTMQDNRVTADCAVLAGVV